jgi:hypothetical protein
MEVLLEGDGRRPWVGLGETLLDITSLLGELSNTILDRSSWDRLVVSLGSIGSVSHRGLLPCGMTNSRSERNPMMFGGYAQGGVAGARLHEGGDHGIDPYRS